MVDVTGIALEWLRLYGPFALLVFTFLETSMLFPFLPSEVVVPAAAALLITGPVSFGTFVLAAAVGGTAGAFVPFYVFHDTRAGRSDWLQRILRVSQERIERGREWFTKWGQSSVLWGRLLPVLRSVVSIPAGIADMRPTKFGAYTAVGTLAFYGATGLVVYYVRQQALFELALGIVLQRPGLAVLGTLALLVMGALVWFVANRGEVHHG